MPLHLWIYIYIDGSNQTQFTQNALHKITHITKSAKRSLPAEITRKRKKILFDDIKHFIIIGNNETEM